MRSRDCGTAIVSSLVLRLKMLPDLARRCSDRLHCFLIRRTIMSNFSLVSVVFHDRLPDRLYKFTRAEYVRSLVDGGVFWIGTLRGYRAAEQLPDDVGDVGEGTALLRDSRCGVQTTETMGWAMSQIFSAEPGGEIHDLNVQIAVDDDWYVYCLHDSNRRSASASMTYDVCIEITEPLAFLQMLSAALHLGAVAVGRCRYYGRDHEIGGNIPPPVPLLKPERFAYQCEWRFLWQCRWRQPAEAFPVWAPAAAKYCRVIPFA